MKIKFCVRVDNTFLQLCKICNTRDQGPYSQHFSFFVTNIWAQQAEANITQGWERLTTDKHSSLLCPLIRFKENEVL